MPDDAKPAEPNPAPPTLRTGEPPPEPSPEPPKPPAEPVVWPRDMTSPPADAPTWGRDPEALRDA